MSFVRQSLRTNPPFGELGDPPLPKDGMILYEEDYRQKPINKSHYKQEELIIENYDKRIRKKELDHVQFIERLILGTYSNQQRRRSSTLSNNNSFQIDKLLQDENNDWFFEKILEKFENIRSKKTNRYINSSSNNFNNGVERIVERRYYVKKPKLVSKRDQLTSTSDLKEYGKKNRQLSNVSSVTAATTCSQCSSSTPTYVENLREQSDSLRNEISELKSEIEHLQTSQQEFFQQLKIHFQSKTVSPNFAPPTMSSLRSPSEKKETLSKLSIPLTTNQRARLISTESDISSITASSGKSTPIRESAVKSITAPSSTSVPAAPPIFEFMATKNPSIAPTPPIYGYVSSKPPSAPSTTSVNAYINSKLSSVVRTPPITEFATSRNSITVSSPPIAAPKGLVGSRTSPVASTPPVVVPVESIGSKTSSVAPTPPVVVPVESVSSKTSSIAPTPVVAASSMPSARIPIYENELAHRRVLSPRSQIVASSASIQDSSSESVTPEPIRSNSQKNSKVPSVTLHDNDIKDLVQYSSQLELSGFPQSINPVIHNPNNSSTFWESVDQFIENSKSTNIRTGLPPISRSNQGSRFGLNNITTKQLDKYDLEIKPQEIIESSAPFLMPPLDTLP